MYAHATGLWRSVTRRGLDLIAPRRNSTGREDEFEPRRRKHLARRTHWGDFCNGD